MTYKLIFKARKSSNGDELQNIYGFETIEIIQFNYDGKGGSLAICDGELSSYNLLDTENIIFGGWYDLTSVG